MPLGPLVWVIILWLLVLVLIVFVARRAYAFFRAHWSPTISTFTSLKQCMEWMKLEWKHFIDLWCGTWSTLHRFAEKNPHITFTWVDINRLALWWWRRNGKRKWINNVKLLHQDIYTVDLSQYDTIYCFLMPSEMKCLQTHFENALQHPATIICAAFKLPDREPTVVRHDDQWVERIFIYEYEVAKS